MDNTGTRKIRNNRMKRKKKRSMSKIAVLIKFVLCAAVIFTAAMISIDKQEKAVFNTEIKQSSSQQETDPDPQETETTKESTDVTNAETVKAETEKNEFEGLTLINDNRGVPVICYHSITTDKSKKGPIVIPKENFREQLKTIKDAGYTTLTMAELSDYLYKNKPIPEKSVVITFDDGYKDNYTEAFPILKEFNMKATIFVISSFIGRSDTLSSSEIKEMSDYGIDIESHTVTHKRLSEESYDDQLKELKDSKKTLEGITNKPVISAAYPEGKYNDNTKKAVIEAGYTMGFTIERGYADRDDKSTLLNRICLDYTYKPNNILNVLKNLKK